MEEFSSSFDTLLKSLKKPANVLSQSLERSAPPLLSIYMWKSANAETYDQTEAIGGPVVSGRYHPEQSGIISKSFWEKCRLKRSFPNTWTPQQPHRQDESQWNDSFYLKGFFFLHHLLSLVAREGGNHGIYQTSRVLQASYLVLVDEEEHDEQNLQEEDKQEQDEELRDTKGIKFNTAFMCEAEETTGDDGHLRRMCEV